MALIHLFVKKKKKKMLGDKLVLAHVQTIKTLVCHTRKLSRNTSPCPKQFLETICKKMEVYLVVNFRVREINEVRAN